MSIFSPTYLRHYRETIILAFPVILSQLGHIMVGVVDTAMVGQIGPVDQAAVSLANGLYTLVLVFGLGVSYGVTPLVAAADSAGNKAENADLLRHSIVVNTLLGVILFAVLFVISPVLHVFDQKQEVVEKAIPFLNVMMLGMIPLCMFSAFKQFAEGLSRTTVAMIITIGANLLNILLNYLMIFGHGGFPEMGLMGSCWASFISRVLMALAMFLYVRYGKAFRDYAEGFRLRDVRGTLTRKILAIGVPSGLQWVFEVGAFSFAVVMIGWISPEAQAAHQIALSLAATTYMMASGLSAAASVRVGNHYGSSDMDGLRRSGYSAFVMVLAFMGLMALLFILFREMLPGLFTNDLQVIEIASSLLVIAAFFQLSDGLQVVALGALRGMKDVRFPTLITLIAYWGIGLPSSYYFAFTLKLGTEGVWYGLSLGLTIAAILLSLRFRHVSRIKLP